jgi:hypothetical protein
VWFACFPPDEAATCHLFLNRELASLQNSKRGGSLSISVPLAKTVTADPRRDFMAVLLSAISLRCTTFLSTSKKSVTENLVL